MRKSLANSQVARHGQISRPTPKARQLLSDFLYWLKANRYARPENYVTNAKTFLKTYKAGSIRTQLETYLASKGYSLRSALNRFQEFLDEKSVDFILNDLYEKALPRSNPYVKLFLFHYQDHLRGDKSLSTYSTILSNYFASIGDNPRNVSKKSVEQFLLSRDLSDHSTRLYKAVLKAFCEWVSEYQQSKSSDLNKEQRQLKKALAKISYKSLREIIAIKIRSPRSNRKGYHKDSLSIKERNKLLSLCRDTTERAIISLMAWNGLRTVEVVRLNVGNINFGNNTIDLWSKGKSNKSRDTIVLFDTPRKELKRYMRLTKRKSGKFFPAASSRAVDAIVRRLFKLLKVKGKYSPHSLRHTAGQIMYDKGIPLEFIQKTLRHAMMETTLVYAQRAIDRNYFKRMKRNL